MKYVKHLSRFCVAAIALGSCVTLPSYAFTNEDFPLADGGFSSSTADAALEIPMPVTAGCSAECLEAIAAASDSAVSGATSEYSSISNDQLSTGILIANGYTPPDNGGPDDSRGSGTR